jgi:hypothetical protein
MDRVGEMARHRYSYQCHPCNNFVGMGCDPQRSDRGPGLYEFGKTFILTHLHNLILLNVIDQHPGQIGILATTKRVAYFSTTIDMATPQQRDALHREGRLELALQAYLGGQFSSVRSAAKAYDVPRSTLQSRLSGTQPKRGCIATNRLLTSTEEECLVR